MPKSNSTNNSFLKPIDKAATLTAEEIFAYVNNRLKGLTGPPPSREHGMLPWELLWASFPLWRGNPEKEWAVATSARRILFEAREAKTPDSLTMTHVANFLLSLSTLTKPWRPYDHKEWQLSMYELAVPHSYKTIKSVEDMEQKGGLKSYPPSVVAVVVANDALKRLARRWHALDLNP